jgi:hypothetical protein
VASAHDDDGQTRARAALSGQEAPDVEFPARGHGWNPDGVLDECRTGASHAERRGGRRGGCAGEEAGGGHGRRRREMSGGENYEVKRL